MYMCNKNIISKTLKNRNYLEETTSLIFNRRLCNCMITHKLDVFDQRCCMDKDTIPGSKVKNKILTLRTKMFLAVINSSRS